MTALAALVRDYLRHVRAFSPSARLFLAAAVLGGVSGGVSNLLLNLYLVSLGFPEDALPRFTRFGLAGAAAAALAGGPLADALQPRRTMLLGTAIVAVGSVLILLAPGSLALGLGILAASAGTVVVYIAAPTFMMRHSSAPERPYLFGVATAAYVVSTAAGAALGGALPEVFRGTMAGVDTATVYRLSLLAGGALSALGIPLLWLTRERSVPLAATREAAHEIAIGDAASPGGATTSRRDRGDGSTSDAAGRSRGSVVSGLWRDLPRRVLDPAFLKLTAQFVLADGLIRIGGNLVLPYLNVFFVNHLGASEAVYGALRFGERALVVLTTLLVALPVTRFGPVATVVVTQVLSVPMLLLLGFAPTLGVAAAAFLVRGPLMEMTQPTRDNFLMEVAPEPARATSFAALTLAGYAIGFASSYLAEWLLRHDLFQAAFAITGALYVVSAAMYWLFFARRPEAAPGRPSVDLTTLATGG